MWLTIGFLIMLMVLMSAIGQAINAIGKCRSFYVFLLGLVYIAAFAVPTFLVGWLVWQRITGG